MSESITMKDVLDGRDKHMISEENRLKSFIEWPFSEGLCTKQSMSGSGFYHCNISGEMDGVRCFCCFKELDGWESSDDPWTEHKRKNNCFFANLGKTQNKLTVKEFLKTIEEREINLMNKRIESLKKEENKLIHELGLPLLNQENDNI